MNKQNCIGCVRDLQYPMFRENITCENCKRRNKQEPNKYEDYYEKRRINK